MEIQHGVAQLPQQQGAAQPGGRRRQGGGWGIRGRAPAGPAVRLRAAGSWCTTGQQHTGEDTLSLLLPCTARGGEWWTWCCCLGVCVAAAQNKKAHRNGIKKPQKHKYTSTKGVSNGAWAGGGRDGGGAWGDGGAVQSRERRPALGGWLAWCLCTGLVHGASS